jgi:hypothetical protein
LETENIEILLIETLSDAPKESNDKFRVESIRVSNELFDKDKMNVSELVNIKLILV